MTLETINQAFVRGSYTIMGNGVDATSAGVGMARIVWIFYASKVVEFIDTIIMVLRKNNRQVCLIMNNFFLKKKNEKKIENQKTKNQNKKKETNQMTIQTLFFCLTFF